MERASEIYWLKWFYQMVDQYITEEQRKELENSFVLTEGRLLPKEYEVEEQ